jgi:penicillin-binding protein 1A
MVGGPGLKKWKYNLVTQNQRQTGSSFKTFVLATLMEQGHSPGDNVSGLGPCKFANPSGTPNPYEVENFGGSGGSVGTVTSQTLRSSNCAYVRLGLVAGIPNVINMAHRLGIKSEIPVVPSVPLGTAGITPLEMASAYSTLANDGVYNAPYLIEKVTDRNDKVLFQHTPAPKQVVSPQTARLVTSVLEQNIQGGTGTRARIRTGQPAAGKTGTHQGSTDAWFVGYSRQLATAVWIGGLHEQFHINLGGTGITGGTYPARIWGDFMTAWHTNRPIEGFANPQGVPGGTMLQVPGGQDLSPPPTTVPPPPPGGGGGPGGPGGPGRPGGPKPSIPPVPAVPTAQQVQQAAQTLTSQTLSSPTPATNQAPATPVTPVTPITPVTPPRPQKQT